jgi:hypothetical protein
MRIGRLLAIAMVTLISSSCVSVLSHSYAYVGPDPRPMVWQSDWTATFLHLTEPLIENSVVDLTHGMEKTCKGGSLGNVQTTVTIREFLLFQIYSVRVSGACAPS